MDQLTLTFLPPRRRGTLSERFWRFVQRGDACWTWTGSRNEHGYGQIHGGPGVGRPLIASRVSWEIHHGPIPDGLLVCHTCDNPSCVNPAHLFLGSHADNGRDMSAKGRAGAHVKPETLSRGDAHYARRQPERLARGDRNGARTKPECVPRGEANGSAKLTAEEVVEIRRLWEQPHHPTQRELAERFGVSPRLVGLVVRRLAWRHVA
jgi:hypothetical protein